MEIVRSTLKPGSLVSLKTSITGLNVNYRRDVIEAEHITEQGEISAEWITKKRVLDAAEHDAAKKARADARNAIACACVQSDFGLLCPEVNTDKLKAAISKANAIVEAFNVTAKLSHISVYTMVGKIEHESQDAMKAINSEVRDLLCEMSAGIVAKDVKTIRDAANKARALNVMLTNDPATRLETAIEWARDTARAIVKDGTGGETGKEAINVIADTMTFFN